MEELKKGDLLCYIPSAKDLMEKKPPITLIVRRDWDCYKHGDLIQVWDENFVPTTIEPDYVQRYEEYGEASW